ncbi:MAG: N,N'-diacetylchitobiose phosphorylase [Oscillospiraceae bacterium]|jgi:N,N'-diacetylchitobiose phosphorylase|nr:N,N'-diacetylchitobiose phosphorylase [Oscillospiraceae bacterium]
MKYGYFDNANREYVIDKVDTPTSWTNYIGVKDVCCVLNQTAGGYSFYKSPEYHRITRFRANSVPIDRPGHWVYIRDDETADVWSISWQPVGKDLRIAKYECRHGLSYSKFSCDYSDIAASQTVFVPIEDAVELWDVILKNNGDKPRKLSVYSYIEWSYHHILMDNQNFQMSNYAAGSAYKDGIIEEDLFYEEFGWQFFASSFEPDGYETLRDKFIGLYHTETNPVQLETGVLGNNTELCGNHCAVLQKKLTLEPGEDARLIFMIGQGKAEEGKKFKEKYSDLNNVDRTFKELKDFWEDKCSRLQVKTPNADMDTELNTWNLYQAEVNIMFSRFASFIEVGGRTGLGYRDTAQDAMAVPHSNPEKTRQRIIELLRAETTLGYGLHLFDPAHFDPDKKDAKPFKSPTVVPEVDKSSIDYSKLDDVCADDALWLIPTIMEYIKETGDISFLDELVTYAESTDEAPLTGTVYEHMAKILDFSAREVGPTGICKGLRADWNDCLNLGGGESAMVSFLHYWAIQTFLEIATYAGKTEDIEKYTAMAEKVKAACEEHLWDGEWYARGVTKNGVKIGTQANEEGKVQMECNTWAVCSGVASEERARLAMDAVDKYLYTDWGLVLNDPCYHVPDDDLGFVTRVYPGVKENGAVFSHSNPWAWFAESKLGRGSRAMKFYNALLPTRQNDLIEIREAEPYSYCQFVYGKDHTAHGRARHPFMTGSGGWAYFSATRHILGIRPEFDGLVIDPCIPADWKEFEATRKWRGATYNIKVTNPDAVEKGVKLIKLNGEAIEGKIVPIQAAGTVAEVEVVLG